MRKPHFALQLDPIASPDAVGRRRPFAYAVERHDRGFIER